MIVSELRAALKDLPDDMEVVLQKDPEGNGYSPLQGADPDCVYDAEEREVYSMEWDADDAAMDEEEWEELLEEPRVLVLYPVY